MMADSAEINSAAALQVFSAALAIRFRDEKLRADIEKQNDVPVRKLLAVSQLCSGLSIADM